jgi:2-dehydropantoate 2-reductase
MRERGLQLRRPSESFTLHPIDAVEHVSEAKGDIELVLFTVKTYDTATAIEAVKPVIGPKTLVLSLQNGVDGVEELGKAFGGERILAGTTTLNAAVIEPGVVVDNGVPIIAVVAALVGGVSPRVQAVADVLTQAGIPTTTHADARLSLWRKFLLFVPHATITSACNQPFGPIFSLPEGQALYRRLFTEAVEVARAEKVILPDDIVETMMSSCATIPANALSSMAHDFINQRRVELDQATGSVVRRARALGVPTPAFDALYTALKVRALAYGGLPEI